MPKEVRYDIYCKKCKYEHTSPSNDPCNDCLGTPDNGESHKPVYFVQAKSLINYLLPDPNVVCYTQDRLKSANWVDKEPDDADLKLYFKKEGEDWYERSVQ